MSEIDRDTVRHVARLARLELGEEEVERLAEEMEDVLSRFAELEEAEEAGAGPVGDEPEAEEPGDGASAPARPEPDDGGLRPDRPDADPLARGPGEMAPEWRDGFFLVPRLEALGGDGGDWSGAGGGRGGDG